MWKFILGLVILMGLTAAYEDLRNNPNVWNATQSGIQQTLAISTSTFTPAAASGNNINITLTTACPCTIANPSGSVIPGTSGIMVIKQSASGSNTVGIWGTSYVTAGGTSTITLSTGANAIDVLSYYVVDATHIFLVVGGLNAIH